MKVGDQVFLSEYQGNEVVLDDKDYFVFSHTLCFKNRGLGSSSVDSACLAFMEPRVQSSVLHKPGMWWYIPVVLYSAGRGRRFCSHGYPPSP